MPFQLNEIVTSIFNMETSLSLKKEIYQLFAAFLVPTGKGGLPTRITKKLGEEA